MDRLYSLILHLNFAPSYRIAEVVHIVNKELTFVNSRPQMMLPESRENVAKMSFMFLSGSTIDEDVIEVDDYVLVENVMKDVIHERLECSRRVAETEGHDEEFKMSILGPKGCLGLVTFSHPDKVVSGLEIDFREYVCIAEAIEGFGDVWESSPVLDRDLV